jgi:hypothetical protein
MKIINIANLVNIMKIINYCKVNDVNNLYKNMTNRLW